MSYDVGLVSKKRLDVSVNHLRIGEHAVSSDFNDNVRLHLLLGVHNSMQDVILAAAK